MDTTALRQKLLDLAIRGRLIPQNPDEPAVELDAEDIVPESEQPFKIPENWRWVKLDAVGQIRGGKRIPIGRKLVTVDTGHKYLRVTDMKGGTVDQSNLLYIEEDIYERIKKYTISSDDIYITVAGTIGNVGLIPEELDGINLTENADKICPDKAKVNKKWLFYYLQSEYIQTQIKEATTKVGQPKLAIRKISSLCITIPPLPEQERIAAKLEQLFEVIDRCEEAQKQIVDTATQLRTSLLQAAIRGKLVPQDPDEPAIELDAKDTVPESEQPFEIPENWRWVRLGKITPYGKCKNIDAKDISADTWILDLEDIEKETGKIIQRKFENNSKSTKHIFHKGDVLYSKLRPNLNKVIVADLDGVCTSEIIPLTFDNKKVNAFYMQYFMRSREFVNYAVSCSYGLKMPRLGTKDAVKAPIPLPPLPEQERIAAKLEQLFTAIDTIQQAAI